METKTKVDASSCFQQCSVCRRELLDRACAVIRIASSREGGGEWRRSFFHYYIVERRKTEVEAVVE